MRKIALERTTFVPTNPKIAWDNVSDYTHFKWCHSKHFVDFQVLHDEDNKQIFFYSSRLLYPLPFVKRYVACRIMDHNSMSFRQIYRDIDTGKKTYFSCRILKAENGVNIENKMVLEVSGVFAFFPKIISLLWNRRLHCMWLEDREILLERSHLGAFDNPKCCPDFSSLTFELSNSYNVEIKQPTQFKFFSD